MSTSRPIAPPAHRLPPARVATSLVGALRAAHGALPWTAGTISKPITNLDQEAISSTHKPDSRVRLRT